MAYIEDSRGRITETFWGYCGRQSHTDEQGLTTTWSYDDRKRVETETGPGSVGDIVTTYEYDASGRVIFETVTAGTLSLPTARDYDTASKIIPLFLSLSRLLYHSPHFIANKAGHWG